MTAALLPPDPTREAQYYLTRTGWNIGKRVEIWRWCPEEPIWRNEQWGPMGADLAGKAGYTLASPHPIPTAAQLDALWELMANLENAVSAYSDPSVDVHPIAYQQTVAMRNRLRATLKGDAP